MKIKRSANDLVVESGYITNLFSLVKYLFMFLT